MKETNPIQFHFSTTAGNNFNTGIIETGVATKSLQGNLQELSMTEHNVLQLLSLGKTYKEIAEVNNVCLDTVKKHCSNIYKKLEVGNKTEAINVFYRLNSKVASLATL
jgi:DNA-binding NarL/FixJ family response regulator